jgi:hypothetical protein
MTAYAPEYYDPDNREICDSLLFGGVVYTTGKMDPPWVPD